MECPQCSSHPVEFVLGDRFAPKQALLWKCESCGYPSYREDQDVPAESRFLDVTLPRARKEEPRPIQCAIYLMTLNVRLGCTSFATAKLLRAVPFTPFSAVASRAPV
jgi:hypothetical protein